MCGIAGLVDFNLKSNSSILKKMTGVLFHRGPDDSGYFFDSIKNKVQIGIGHRRLSILDLSSHGNQPMEFCHLKMVYNGEVYNFKEIRSELEKYGYDFVSSSDTEVILKAYHKWGFDAVHRFNGMFAIAIFDRQKQTLNLIRDRAGVKPLYWYQEGDLFLFSSELKSFHEHPDFKKKLNHDSLSLFFKYGYIPQPHTIFSATHKLEAGHILEFSITDLKLKIEKYWDVIDCYNQPKLNISKEEALTETERLLKSACEYRMISDVPVGVFLSGGYDSSIITALLQSERIEKIKTFSIGFHEEKYNEAPHAKRVANYLGTDHAEYYCTQKDALEILPKLPEIWDEPFGDVSAIPTILVSQLARKDVTVALSADGGDEVFGGYDKYTNILKHQNILEKIPNKKILSKMINNFYPSSIYPLNKMYKFNRYLDKTVQLLDAKHEGDTLSLAGCIFTSSEVNILLAGKTKKIITEFDSCTMLDKELLALDKLLAIDYKTYQSDDILSKVDRATMSVGLEGREPMLDHNVIEFIARLDPKLKIHNGKQKILLKEITHKYISKEIMDRPKMGFGVPIDNWFKDELKVYLLHYLDERRLSDEGVFNVEFVVSLRDRYLSGEYVIIKQLWLLLVFEMWRERWM
jgi:asparagine synthase (glutamine-hydrolysing)